jgi:hypothetical protein
MVVQAGGNTARGMKDNRRMAAKKTADNTQPALTLDDKGQLARVRGACNENRAPSNASLMGAHVLYAEAGFRDVRK